MLKNQSGKASAGLLIFVLIIAAVVLLVVFASPAEKKAGSFAESVEHKIMGIEPGAGIMINTEKTMNKYGLKEAGWKLVESSSAAMLTAVEDAVKNKEPIVATVWQPHAAFAVADIRKLEDPKNVYNSPSTTKAFLKKNAPEWADAEVKSDVLASVVYKGFKEDAPAAYEFFQNFQIPASTQSDWIYKYSVEEKGIEEITDSYISNNTEKVENWKPEEAELGKDKIVLGIPPWPGATVKSHVVAGILEDMGYTTEVKEMDVGVVYTALADEQIDVNVAGWLPTTHQDYWTEHKDELEIAGINVTLTWLGLGVPEYTDESIQSISDLTK